MTCSFNFLIYWKAGVKIKWAQKHFYHLIPWNTDRITKNEWQIECYKNSSSYSLKVWDQYAFELTLCWINVLPIMSNSDMRSTNVYNLKYAFQTGGLKYFKTISIFKSYTNEKKNLQCCLKVGIFTFTFNCVDNQIVCKLN